MRLAGLRCAPRGQTLQPRSKSEHGAFSWAAGLSAVHRYAITRSGRTLPRFISNHARRLFLDRYNADFQPIRVSSGRPTVSDRENSGSSALGSSFDQTAAESTWSVNRGSN